VYRHRDEREAGVKFLVGKFPGCFFEDPKLRRPLKKNIVDDLNKEKVLNPEAVTQVIGWYQNHYSYKYSLIAGAPRIDLNGTKVGTVTLQEQAEALAQIAARKRQMKCAQVRRVLASMAAPPAPSQLSMRLDPRSWNGAEPTSARARKLRRVRRKRLHARLRKQPLVRSRRRSRYVSGSQNSKRPRRRDVKPWIM
jgi:sRNA-binding protein